MSPSKEAGERPGENWLTSAVNIGHLIIAAVTIIGTVSALMIANESRLTKLETKFDVTVANAKMRNDTQDTAIVASQSAVNAIQISMAQVTSKLDYVSAQLASMTRAIEQAQEGSRSNRRY